MENNWVSLVVAILSGLVTAIPLVTKLIEYVRVSAKEKNWDKIVALTIKYMQMAEQKFTDGATKKEWVLSAIKASAEGIDYDLDDASLSKISDMIDSFCDAARIINVPSLGPDSNSSLQ